MVPNAKEKDDAVDYFAAGKTDTDLLDLIEAASPFVPDAAITQKLWTWQELLRTQFKPPTWLLDQILPEVGLTILGGKPKVGKSWLALQIAGAIAAGDEIFGQRAAHARVLYFAIEDKAPRIKNRGLLQDMDPNADIVFADSLEPLDSGGMEVLDGLLASVDPKCVVIDTLASAKTGKTDENSAGQMAEMLNKLQTMAHERLLSIILVAHHRKGVTGDVGGDLRGSSAISAAADMIMSLTRTPPAYTLSVEGRDTEDAEYRMVFEDYRWKLRGNARVLAKAEAEMAVCEVLTRYGISDATFVGNQLGWHRTTAMRVLKDLEFQRRVQSETDRSPDHRVLRILYKMRDF